MIGHILIVVSMGVSISTHSQPRHYPIVTMQRFDTPKACLHAAAEIQRLAGRRVNAVCVPERA